MSEAITTGVFGTLILTMLVYLATRIDRLADKVEALGERVAHLEGQRS